VKLRTENNPTDMISDARSPLAPLLLFGTLFGTLFETPAALATGFAATPPTGPPCEPPDGLREGSIVARHRIGDGAGGLRGPLGDESRFGTSLAPLGDLDGDGFEDLAVGAPRDDDGGDRRGAVWILFLEGDGSVRATSKISDLEGTLHAELPDGGSFGASLAGLGDLDRDGIGELAVGAPRANRGEGSTGEVWILCLDSTGGVNRRRRIATGRGTSIGLAPGDEFGNSLAVPGDLDRDGRADLAVGARGDDLGGEERSDRGAVWILHLDALCRVKLAWKIDANTTGGNEEIRDFDRFGAAVARGGDLDGNGCGELLVGAAGDGGGGVRRGAIWVLFLTDCITADATQRNGAGGNPLRLRSVTPPRLGGEWEAEVDCGDLEKGTCFLFLSRAPLPGTRHRTGEVLINPLPAKLIGVRAAPHEGNLVRFHFSLPDEAAFCGARIHLQACILGAPRGLLTNALDLVIGR
jgi:hypothetical protein